MQARKKATAGEDARVAEFSAVGRPQPETGSRSASGGPEQPFSDRIQALAQAMDRQLPRWVPPGGAWPEQLLSLEEFAAAAAQLTRRDLTSILNDEQQLPPAPQILFELKAVTAGERFGVEDIAGVILKDAGLSAFLLRLVNSAFYSLPSRVDTISRAVGILGVKPLYSLALGYIFADAQARLPRNMPDREGLWRHSLAVGIAAQAVWETIRGREDSERLFVAGLLHDLGKLILAVAAPEHAELVYARGAGLAPAQALEEICLGFDHARLGGLLLKKWNMPASLAAAVQWHHNPQQAAQYWEPAVVHLADVMVSALGLGVRPGALLPACASCGKLEEMVSAGCLEQICTALAARWDDVYAAFTH